MSVLKKNIVILISIIGGFLSMQAQVISDLDRERIELEEINAPIGLFPELPYEGEKLKTTLFVSSQQTYELLVEEWRNIVTVQSLTMTLLCYVLK